MERAPCIAALGGVALVQRLTARLQAKNKLKRQPDVTHHSSATAQRPPIYPGWASGCSLMSRNDDSPKALMITATAHTCRSFARLRLPESRAWDHPLPGCVLKNPRIMSSTNAKCCGQQPRCQWDHLRNQWSRRQGQPLVPGEPWDG